VFPENRAMMAKRDDGVVFGIDPRGDDVMGAKRRLGFLGCVPVCVILVSRAGTQPNIVDLGQVIDGRFPAFWIVPPVTVRAE